VLKSGITPATYCSFINFNVNSQLNRFGVHNGGAQDAILLNENWESIGIVPVDGLVWDDDEWFVFSLSDNDFITQDGVSGRRCLQVCWCQRLQSRQPGSCVQDTLAWPVSLKPFVLVSFKCCLITFGSCCTTPNTCSFGRRTLIRRIARDLSTETHRFWTPNY